MVMVEVCRLDQLVPGRGVAALVAGEQVAIFRFGDAIYAVGNRDPFSGANVIARGLMGSIDGTRFVASPVYKQRFELVTGRCLDDPDVRLPVYPADCRDGIVRVGATPAECQVGVGNAHDRVTVG